MQRKSFLFLLIDRNVSDADEKDEMPKVVDSHLNASVYDNNVDGYVSLVLKQYCNIM